MPQFFFLAAGAPLPPLFIDMLLILAAAGTVAIVAARLRLATVPAYLITGALIGPGALKIVKEADQVREVAELAIILLLFGIGLHMDMSVLRDSLRRIIVATLISATLCTAALWPVGMMFHLKAPPTLALGMALAISSTVVVLRILQQRRELNRPEGRISLGVLIIQDLVAIVILLLLPVLAKWNGTGTSIPAGGAEQVGVWELLWTLAVNGTRAMAGVVALVGFGKFILPRLLHEAAKRSQTGEVTTVISIAAAMGAAGITQIVGLGPSLGAFLAGFMLSVTLFRHQLGSQIGAIRDLFSAVFFTAIGMSVNLHVLWDNLGVVLAATAAMLLIKMIVISLTAWGCGATGNVAFKVGAALAQAGEFSIVVLFACQAPGVGLLNEETVGKVVAVIVLSLMATPVMMYAAAAIAERMPRIPTAPWMRHVAGDDSTATDHRTGARGRKHAIIAGYGLVGRAVADELRKTNVTSTIIEMNPSTVKKQHLMGRAIVFGDASSPEILEIAGIHEADALILTIPDEESVLRACRTAREMRPELPIIARTNFVSQGILAASLGASGVVVEEMATAREMERVAVSVLKCDDKPTA